MIWCYYACLCMYTLIKRVLISVVFHNKRSYTVFVLVPTIRKRVEKSSTFRCPLLMDTNSQTMSYRLKRRGFSGIYDQNHDGS